MPIPQYQQGVALARCTIADDLFARALLGPEQIEQLALGLVDPFGKTFVISQGAHALVYLHSTKFSSALDHLCTVRLCVREPRRGEGREIGVFSVAEDGAGRHELAELHQKALPAHKRMQGEEGFGLGLLVWRHVHLAQGGGPEVYEARRERRFAKAAAHRTGVGHGVLRSMEFRGFQPRSESIGSPFNSLRHA